MSSATEALPARLRTTPQQARSQARMNAALTAAARLLERDGAEAVTTTRVAHEASMAVGSVYRYFPDKAAILDALATRYLGEFEQLMEQMVRRAQSERWDDPVGLLVDLYADYYRSQPALRAIWFGTGLSDEMVAADREHKRAMAHGLERVARAQGLLDVQDLSAACHACVLTADAILQEAFRMDPQGDAALLTQAKAMLRAYLQQARR